MEKRKLIFINGVGGVGKTTTSRALAELLKDENFIHLEEDEWASKEPPWYTHRTSDGYLCGCVEVWRVDVAEKHLDKALKMHNVILDDIYHVEIEKELLSKYADNADIEFWHFVLHAPFDVVEKRTKNDFSHAKEWARLVSFDVTSRGIKKQYSDAIWIDTSNKKPDEIAKEIKDIVYQ